MSKSNCHVALVTNDARLEARVREHMPTNTSLRVLRDRELSDESAVTASELWLDLDATHHDRIATNPFNRRVYFYSGHQPADPCLPSGLFIRKNCPSMVLSVLWAGATLNRHPGPTSTIPATASLPSWLLEFHELNLKILCRRLVHRLPTQLGYRAASLYLHDASRGLLRLADTTHQRQIDLIVPLNHVDRSLMAAAGQSGKIIHTDDVAAELASRGIHRSAGERPNPDGGCMIAPLISDGRLCGVLNLSEPAADSQQQPLPLTEIFIFLGRALHHATAFTEVRTEARVDELTGLFNQRWMNEAVSKEVRRAQRYGSPLSLLMIDLDGLKRVNDNDGHAAGNCVLRHVASRITSVLRQFDGAARVGGDEFIVMLPSTTMRGAMQVARRLLDSIRDDVAQFDGKPLSITASVGVAEWQPGWTAQQLFNTADRAMYAGKAQGRNIVICHRPDATDAETPQRPPTTDSVETPRFAAVDEPPNPVTARNAPASETTRR